MLLNNASLDAMRFLQGDGAPAQSSSPKTEAKVSGQNGTQKKTENGTETKKSGSKHPLRIPGMKPGEGCFICKGTDHIAKLCPTKTSRDRKKVRALQLSCSCFQSSNSASFPCNSSFPLLARLVSYLSTRSNTTFLSSSKSHSSSS